MWSSNKGAEDKKFDRDNRENEWRDTHIVDPRDIQDLVNTSGADAKASGWACALMANRARRACVGFAWYCAGKWQAAAGWTRPPGPWGAGAWQLEPGAPWAWAGGRTWIYIGWLHLDPGGMSRGMEVGARCRLVSTWATGWVGRGCEAHLGQGQMPGLAGWAGSRGQEVAGVGYSAGQSSPDRCLCIFCICHSLQLNLSNTILPTYDCMIRQRHVQAMYYKW